MSFGFGGPGPTHPTFTRVWQDASTWAVVKIQSTSFDEVMSSMFGELYRFIKEKGIPMTPPVVMTRDGPHCSMRFKIDPAFEGRLIDGTPHDITILRIDAREMRVYDFSGWFTSPTDKAINRALSDMKVPGVTFDGEGYMVASYTSPVNILKPYKRNEIWIPSYVHTQGVIPFMARACFQNGYRDIDTEDANNVNDILDVAREHTDPANEKNTNKTFATELSKVVNAQADEFHDAYHPGSNILLKCSETTEAHKASIKDAIRQEHMRLTSLDEDAMPSGGESKASIAAKGIEDANYAIGIINNSIEAIIADEKINGSDVAHDDTRLAKQVAALTVLRQQKAAYGRIIKELESQIHRM